MHEYAFGNTRVSCRIGCAGVAVGAGLRLVAVRVNGRSMAGSSGVPQRSIAVMALAGWQIAGRMARHAMRCASCPRCPRAASFFAEIGPVGGQWRDRRRTAQKGPAVPVPGSLGNPWRAVNDGRAERISKAGQLSGACAVGGVAGIGCGGPVA
jgi:hypothetical protein